MIHVGGRAIGAGAPVFVIAEAGVNHNGDLDMACRLVDVAAEAGADAVKFQTYRAEKVVAAMAPKARYQAAATGDAESQLDMIRRFELSFAAFRALHAYCERRGITFLSTPFDDESADFLDDLDVPAFKIPSGEITNLPFIARIAAKKRPLIVSTGMSYLAEVDAAVRTIHAAGNSEFALLHCVSNYPTAPGDVNLRAMRTMVDAFGVPVGYSDHTQGIAVAVAAVALGACIIEKHFTLDPGLPGPDHASSLAPDELGALVQAIRTAESALGDGDKRPAPGEAEVAAVARRSLVAASDIAAGAVLGDAAVACLRPGTGLPPAMRDRVVGRRARKAITAGTVLTLEMLE